jgi:HSP20 family protein
MEVNMSIFRSPAKRNTQNSPQSPSNQPIRKLQNEIDSLFNSFFHNNGGLINWDEDFLNRGTLSPNMDLSENDKEYNVSLEVPGISEKDVDVNVENGVLTIQGEKSHSEDNKDNDFYVLERSYGKFHRSFSLPNNVDENNVSAKLKDGILQVKLPKTSEKQGGGHKVKISSE